MKSFVAIDFETANHCMSSVCSVGIVVVENNEVIEKFYRLIQPRPNFYAYWNTRIHGLTANDTEQAAAFPQVWNEIAPKIGKKPLVAHNSPFDEGCLRAAHATYEMNYPDYKFYCTCKASRKVFGRLLPDHKLPTVAAHCGYLFNNHHHALADAEACAAIALRIL